MTRGWLTYEDFGEMISATSRRKEKKGKKRQKKKGSKKTRHPTAAHQVSRPEIPEQLGFFSLWR